MESTLNSAFKDLTGEVGQFLGYGRGADNDEATWTAKQQANVDRSVKGGMRNFYFPGIVRADGTTLTHNWSFLKPVQSLTLASGSTAIELPDDCGGVEGSILVSTSGAGYEPVEFTGIGRVYERTAKYPATTGRPQLCCLDAIKGTGPLQSSRQRLKFWPIADQAYMVRVQYYILPDYLSGAFPYAYGGPTHAETLLESCLAVAEKIVDDQATVHSAEFEKRLAVSMDLDRRNKPQNLGYNGDRSDLILGRRWNPRLGRYYGDAGITIGGVQY